MSDSFEERERGYEAKWAHDEQTLFNIMAKRNSWLAQWAVETMQLSSPEIGGYVQAVVNAGMTGKGKDPVFEKIRRDFEARKVGCPDAVIRRKMKDLFEMAAEKDSAKSGSHPKT